MKKTITGLVMVAALMAAVCAGCGGGEYYRAAGYPPEVALNETERAFIMPVWLDMPGDNLPIATAFIGGMASACGSACVSGQPLQAPLEAIGMQGLSYRVARAMYHGAVHGVWWEGEFAAIPGLIGQLLEAVNENMPEANFRYVVVADVWQLGTGTVPGTVRIRLLGGLWDIQQQQVATVFWSDETMPEATVNTNAGIMGNRVISMVTCPSDDCVAEEARRAGFSNVNFHRF